jgi:hypothetical protein
MRDFGVVDRIRLETQRNVYMSTIETLPRSDGLRFITFDWGSTGGAGVVNILRTLVYDESDEIALPPAQRTPLWKNRAGSLCAEPHFCATYVSSDGAQALPIRRISAHFYLVKQYFQ